MPTDKPSQQDQSAEQIMRQVFDDIVQASQNPQHHPAYVQLREYLAQKENALGDQTIEPD